LNSAGGCFSGLDAVAESASSSAEKSSREGRFHIAVAHSTDAGRRVTSERDYSET
jgi:hypothetical protein